LNANVFAGYASDLQAYFDFLEAGGIPSAYEPLSQAVIAQYLAELQNAGANERFLADLSDFYAAYFAFVSNGGNPDTFPQLPIPPDFGLFANSLNAYANFLANGGFPADFSETDLAVLANFIEALDDAGELDQRLGANADLLEAFFAFVNAGGQPNAFAGLPIYADYVAALNQYFAFLAAGGFPQDYDVVDQATLNTFLAALGDAQGGLDGFGDLNGFFGDYAAFVLASGDPTAFAGLPIYAQYVADLNAYFAFLAAGGLPSEYTVIDPAVLTAYLDALTDTQGGLAGFGALNGFFQAYASFVLGGGDPTTFAGLPVFAQYVADLNAYFAFLADGGLPSEYTVLSQDILNAYLALLANAQGGLIGFAALDQFFVDYFAFLQGGGDADQFAGLPANEGRPLNALNGINGWQFAADGLRVATANAEITDEGRITSLTVFNPNGVTTDYSDRDADLREFGRIGNDVAWTRYFVGAGNGGRTNVSEHLFVGTPAFNVPSTGVVQYALVGGTAPTNSRDTAGSEAFFTGELGVAFGSTAQVGLNFDLLTRTQGYRVSTAGGAADPTNGGLGVDADGRFSSNALPITALSDTTCSAFCQAQIFGGLFGDGATSAGFTFNVFDQSADNSVQGVAIFAAQGDAIAGLGTEPDNSPPVPTGTGTPLILDFANEFGADSPIGVVGFSAPFENEDSLRPLGSDQNAFAEVAANGSVSSLGGDFLGLSIGSASATDVSGNARHLIGRWTDGTVDSTFFTELPYSTAQGAHYFVAAPIGNGFAIPTTGQVEYELIAATAPTVADGRQAPGQFEAGIILTYGASEVGLALDALITIPDDAGDFTYRITTPGGLDNPEDSFFTLNTFGQGRFDITIGGGFVTDSTGVCQQNTTADCRFNATGAFSGDDVDQFALSYTAFHPDRDEGQSISGAAIFGSTSPTGGDTGSTAVGGVEEFDTSVLVTAAISYGEEGFTRTSRTNQSDVSPQGVLNSIGSFGRGTAVGDQIIGD
ncbi:MAG: hypothetical protein HRT64_11085, partial [Erythrobacter sp.]|nr:hypothetical protein [Erythrobacter sp.]